MSFKKLLAFTTLLITPLAANTAQAHDWTGPYLGVNIGSGSGGGDTDFTPLPDAATFVSLAPTTLDTDPSGVIFGVQAGYNFAGAGDWVWGIEGDLQSSDVSGDVTVTPITQDDGTPFSGAGFLYAEQDTEWFATLRGRLGYTVTPNLVLYGTAGLAWGDVSYAAVTDFRPDGPNFYPAEVSETQTGWAAGGGLDWRLGGGKWSARAEYLYYDLGDASQTANASPVASPPYQVAYDWETSQHTFRIGLNYAFGH